MNTKHKLDWRHALKTKFMCFIKVEKILETIVDCGGEWPAQHDKNTVKTGVLIVSEIMTLVTDFQTLVIYSVLH